MKAVTLIRGEHKRAKDRALIPLLGKMPNKSVKKKKKNEAGKKCEQIFQGEVVICRAWRAVIRASRPTTHKTAINLIQITNPSPYYRVIHGIPIACFSSWARANLVWMTREKMEVKRKKTRSRAGNRWMKHWEGSNLKGKKRNQRLIARLLFLLSVLDI